MVARLRMGLIGGGNIARAHARAHRALDLCDLVAVAETDRDRGRAFASEIGAAWHADWTNLVARRDIEAVTICLPHAYHAAAAIDAARAGKQILCEKPIATSLADADAMIDAARAAGVCLMIGHTHRFRKEHLVANDLLRSGCIGRIHYARDIILAGRETIAPPGWRSVTALNGGGVMMDNGIHAADRLLWWMGSEATWVTARLHHATEIVEDEDLGVALIGFASGASAILEESFAVPADRSRCDATFFGSEGLLRVTTWSGVGFARIGEPWREVPIPEEGLDGFEAEIAEFVAAIREGREPSVTGEDGRRALALIQAIYAAAQSGAPCDPRSLAETQRTSSHSREAAQRTV